MELKRCCDLVMRGGITSGVLYPSAIQQIAGSFHLIGIGGTSAGVIAASASAAAEHRRRVHGSFEGFAGLAQVSTELSQEGRLLNLFRPDRSTEYAYERLYPLLDDNMSSIGKARLYLRRKKVFRQLVKNGFGLCTGMANGMQATGHPPLTEWLADLIDELAGRSDGQPGPRDEPLTFRDLHQAPIPPSLRGVVGPDRARSIDFRAVTTCVTFRRPFELPFRAGGKPMFAFEPTKWRELFPTRIVDYLEHKASNIDAPELKRDGKLPLPTDDLPIVVAARMSLSFPLLFTMVPLWCVNSQLPTKPLMPVWFSDGGITSNFPMHRFDALYPRWPTIGLNVRYTDKSYAPQFPIVDRKPMMVHMPPNRDAASVLWDRFHEAPDPHNREPDFQEAALRFVRVLSSSAQEWHDNAFLELPGYRDRSVEIWLEKDEGRLNLEMDEETVKSLVTRGRAAGKLAVDRFATTDPSDTMSWQGHRWARFRAGMSSLMDLLQRLDRSIGSDMPDDISLWRYLNGQVAPPSFTEHFNDEQRKAMKTIVEALRDLADKASTQPTCTGAAEARDRPFCHGPDPRADLGSRAPF